MNLGISFFNRAFSFSLKDIGYQSLLYNALKCFVTRFVLSAPLIDSIRKSLHPCVHVIPLLSCSYQASHLSRRQIISARLWITSRKGTPALGCDAGEIETRLTRQDPELHNASCVQSSCALSCNKLITNGAGRGTRVYLLLSGHFVKAIVIF